MHAVEIDRLVALRTLLDGAGYDSAAVDERLATGDWLAEQVARRRLTDSPLDVLIRLFSLGRPVPAGVVGPSVLEVLEPLGLVGRRAELVEPLVAISAYRSLRLLSDVDVALARQRADHVGAVSFSSELCDQLTIRRPVHRALDLGCGSGVLALLAAADAGTVVAVDVNPRACAFTERNAVLNGIANVEVCEGSWYEPIAGDRFDLIVANIPFVISAERRWLHRDSELPGDALTEQIAGGLVAHLRPDGFATMTGSWFDGAAAAGWVGPGADVVVVTARSLEPDAHAVVWGSDVPPESTVHEGALVVRKRDGGQSAGAASLGALHVGPLAAHVQAMFEAGDELRASDDHALLDRCVALADWTVVHEALALVDGEVVVNAARIGATTGLDTCGALDEVTLELVRGLDGAVPLRVRIGELQDELGGAADLEAQAVAIVRTMLAAGLLRLSEPSR